MECRSDRPRGCRGPVPRHGDRRGRADAPELRRPLLRTLPRRALVTGDEALLQLLAELKARHYHFTTVTPATPARVIARPISAPAGLRDIFGWSRPFREEELEPALLELLRAAA